MDLTEEEEIKKREQEHRTVKKKKVLMTQITLMIIKPVSPKGNQSWMFIRRTDAKAEALILWPPDAE